MTDRETWPQDDARSSYLSENLRGSSTLLPAGRSPPWPMTGDAVALAADHLLYGFVLSEFRRPQG